MKKITLIGSFLLLTTMLQAQSIIEFGKETHDFGTFDEGKIANYDFIFKNTGKSPLLLQSVEPSCGCTTPAYPREPIAPGKSGKITVSYNSQGRLNTFNKSITVRTNSTEPVKILYIKGFVNPKITSTSQASLSLSNTNASLGTLQHGQKVLHKVTLSNIGTEDLIISNVRSDCNCVVPNFTTQTIKPQASVVLELRYAPRNKGTNTDAVMIYSNDGKASTHTVSLQATISEGSLVKENKTKNPFGL